MLSKGESFMYTIFEAWNLYCSTSNIKQSSLKSQTYKFNNHLVPYWKEKDIHNMNNLEIVHFRKYLIDKKLSLKTVSVCLSLLRTILRTSKRYGVNDTTIPYFDMPKFDNKRTRYLSEVEASQLLSALYLKNEKWHDITLFALNTGLRAGEIFALQQENINFAQHSLNIVDTKNSQNRVIPINDTALGIVHKYASKNYTFLFSDIKTRDVSPVFRQCVELVKLNHNVKDRRNRIVFHTLRHTFASWLVQRGVSLMVLSQLLGHKDLKMTMRYAHLAPDQGKLAVDLLSNNISLYT